MAHSFGVVEEKLLETEFFLGLFGSAGRSFDSRFYFSAFVSAARSVTFALQFSMKEVDGFEAWYATAQAALKADSLAPHFVEMRNDVQKKGLNRLNAVPVTHLRQHLAEQLVGGSPVSVLVLPSAKSGSTTVLTDALEASRSYFKLLVSLVFDAYAQFKTVVDPRWYFTQANFEAAGRTLEDALVELGFPSSWVAAAPHGAEAWRVLRSQQPSCALNELFERYLNKSIVDPDEAAEQAVAADDPAAGTSV
jgi:hypothetical protein